MTNNKYLKIMIFLYATIFFFSFVSIAIAEDSITDKPLEITTHQKDNCSLTSKMENTLLIDDEWYIFDNKTEFLDQFDDNSFNALPVTKLIFPSRINITFDTFSHYTEGFPYKSDDKLLKKVVINQKLNEE